jgi:hypothetical protein
MQRFWSIILLLCFGALVPMQGMSWRWCSLENKVVLTGCGVSNGEIQVKHKCCDNCDPGIPAEGGGDCCMDMDGLADFNSPAAPDRLPSGEALESLLSFMEWDEWRPLVVGAEPVEKLEIEEPVPIRAGQRRAILSIWTV